MDSRASFAKRAWSFRAGTKAREILAAIEERLMTTLGAISTSPSKMIAQLDLMHKKTDTQSQSIVTAKSDLPLWRVRLGGSSSWVYLVLPQQDVFQAGKAFGPLLDHLALFTTKLVYSFEGKEFRVGDFLIRVGGISVGAVSNNRIFVEVEYTGCRLVDGVCDVFREFSETLLKDLVVPGGYGEEFRSDTEFLDGGFPYPLHYYTHCLPTLYSDKHTALTFVYLIQSWQVHQTAQVNPQRMDSKSHQPQVRPPQPRHVYPQAQGMENSMVRQ